MSAAARIPREMVARKPPHGSICNNCGLCCYGSLCDLAQHVFERPARPGPCPALVLDGPEGTSRCGLATSDLVPRALREAAALLIFAGVGCDSRINGEPESAEQRARERAFDLENREKLAAARSAWSMPEPSAGAVS